MIRILAPERSINSLRKASLKYAASPSSPPWLFALPYSNPGIVLRVVWNDALSCPWQGVAQEPTLGGCSGDVPRHGSNAHYRFAHRTKRGRRLLHAHDWRQGGRSGGRIQSHRYLPRASQVQGKENVDGGKT